MASKSKGASKTQEAHESETTAATRQAETNAVAANINQNPEKTKTDVNANGVNNNGITTAANGSQSEGDPEAEIWKYFVRDGQNNAKCKMCHKTFKVDGNATIGLAVHLRNAHRIGLKRSADESDSGASSSVPSSASSSFDTTPLSSRHSGGGGSSSGYSTGPKNIFKDGDRSMMTPTKLSRLDEKNALVGLNNRLAVILDRNRQLEVENTKLTGQLKTAEETLVVTSNKLQQTFEKESGDIRKKLENVEKEKVKSDLAKNNLAKDLNDAMTKLQNREKDLASSQKALKDTETKLNNAVSDLKKVQDEKDKLAKDKKELADENSALKKAQDDLRKKLEAEALAKISAEAALRTKGEELTLKSQVHAQEVTVLMAKKQTEVQQISDKLGQEYQAKLDQVIQQLRNDCNAQIQANKEDQENLFNMKEDNLRKQMEKSKAVLKEKIDELNQINKKLGEAEKKIMVLDGEKFNLQQNLKDVEKKYKDEVGRAEKEKKGLENELNNMQDDKEKLINEYQDLMEVKIGLDNEIAVYRRLLEGEEERLNISLDKTPEQGSKRKEKHHEKQMLAA